MRFSPLIFTAILLASNVYGGVSMDTQIEKIMNAPASERVGLMNQLKIKLATMNEEERKEALQKLQGGAGREMGKGSQNQLSAMPIQQINLTVQPNSSNRH